jgi:signal transduction histidine kinase
MAVRSLGHDAEPVTSMRRRDLALAACLGVLVLAWTHGIGQWTPSDRDLDILAYLLVGGNAVLLVWRRRVPLWVLAGTTAQTTTYLLLGYPYGPALLLFAVAVYTAARYLPWRTAALASALALCVLVVHLFTNSSALPGLLGLVPASAWVVVPFAVGTTVAQRRDAIDRARQAAVDHRISEERLRVAQEVHDVVGHGLAAIKMQADIALHLLPRSPEHAQPALEAVSQTSAQALAELRSTLGMVRAGPDQGSSTPGLRDLDALYRRMRDAGLQVRVRTTGAPARLTPDADLAAYRTVQESLTNVLKHSDHREADITIDHGEAGVQILVTSPCPREPRPPTTEGVGIVGMRERVTAQGGTMSAGPDPAGRFVVRAWLPAGTAA